MKKYKLIKKYPGSPELGSICKKDCNNRWVYSLDFSKESTYYTLGHPKFYPEFWEEVVEKDYEILSFRNKESEGPRMYTKLQQDGTYTCDGNFNGASEQWCIDKGYKIHSIKRLSDGEVFTVGDRVDHNYYKGNPKIEKLYFIEKDRLSVYIGGGWNVSISTIEHIKQPLFTTEDGVDIFEGDKVYKLMKGSFCLTSEKYENQKENDYCFYFSTREAAEECILMNKPCLSIKDILKRFRWLEVNENTIKELVKEKQEKLV